MSSAVSGFDFDVDEWDPNTGPLTNHVIAGSVAGIAEHIVMFPVDTIKTHMQCSSCLPSQSFSENPVFSLVKQQGITRLWRGVSTMFMACIPAHAAYFSIYELCKIKFGANNGGHHPLAAGLSGAIATLFHDSIMTPMDVIKQRLQLGHYRGVMDCMRTIIQIEGPRAFFLSFPVTLAMNLPYGGVMMASNESIRRFLKPNGNLTLGDHIVSSSFGSAIAAYLTTPLDVVKTRLQTQNFSSVATSSYLPSKMNTGRILSSPLQEAHATHVQQFQIIRTTQTGRSSCLNSNCKINQPIRYTGLIESLSTILKQEGARGLFSGAIPRVLVATPSMTIAWTTYEFIKSKLNHS